MTTGSRAVRCRILFTAPSPSTTTRLSKGATCAGAAIQAANKSDKTRTAVLRCHYGTGQMVPHLTQTLTGCTIGYAEDPAHGRHQRTRDMIRREFRGPF